MKHIKLFEEFVNEGGIFLDRFDNWMGYDWQKFQSAFLKLNKDNKIIHDKKNEYYYGMIKGEKDPVWKFDDADKQLMFDIKRDLVGGLVYNYNHVSKNHPWS